MGRGETRVNDSEVWGLRREKVKGGEKKWDSLPWERKSAKKLCVPRLQMKKIFIENAMREGEIVFQKYFLENNL